MDKPVAVYVTYIGSTREKVWLGLTDPEFTRQYWFGRPITSEWRVGSRVEYLGPDGRVAWEGEVLEAEAPSVLAYTFHMLISEEHRAEKASRLRFELEDVQGVVKLTLTHDEVEVGSKTAETTFFGWPALMSSLKSLMETGKALPFVRFGFGPGQQQGN